MNFYLMQIVKAKHGTFVINDFKECEAEGVSYAVLTEVHPENYNQLGHGQLRLPLSILTPAPRQVISDKLAKAIAKGDESLRKKGSWCDKELADRVRKLWEFKSLECGWRQSCGKTDPTHVTHRAWLQIIKKLRAAGFVIDEEPQKHGNAYATSKGGFWHSIIYRLQECPA